MMTGLFEAKMCSEERGICFGSPGFLLADLQWHVSREGSNPVASKLPIPTLVLYQLYVRYSLDLIKKNVFFQIFFKVLFSGPWSATSVSIFFMQLRVATEYLCPVSWYAYAAGSCSSSPCPTSAQVRVKQTRQLRYEMLSLVIPTPCLHEI
jgi:hypothetical protein